VTCSAGTSAKANVLTTVAPRAKRITTLLI
jgi:hypothetical protein